MYYYWHILSSEDLIPTSTMTRVINLLMTEYANNKTFEIYTYIGFTILILTKSAIWIFHVFLFDAMSGPGYVSSLLHSSTLVIAPLILLMNYQINYTIK